MCFRCAILKAGKVNFCISYLHPWHYVFEAQLPSSVSFPCSLGFACLTGLVGATVLGKNLVSEVQAKTVLKLVALSVARLEIILRLNSATCLIFPTESVTVRVAFGTYPPFGIDSNSLTVSETIASPVPELAAVCDAFSGGKFSTAACG